MGEEETQYPPKGKSKSKKNKAKVINSQSLEVIT